MVVLLSLVGEGFLTLVFDVGVRAEIKLWRYGAGGGGMETGRVVGRMSVGGRTITQFATQITQAPACCVPGIVKWSQRVQASAASDTERGGGTGGSESKREGWMCRVGGGKVCHIRQHLAPRAGPLKSDITQRVKINGWSFRPQKKKGGVGKYGWRMPNGGLRAGRPFSRPPKVSLRDTQAHRDPVKIR